MLARNVLAGFFVGAVGFALVGQLLLALNVPGPVAVGVAVLVGVAAWAFTVGALQRWDYLPEEVG